VIINVPDQSSWVIANIKHAGYYRVNYDTNNWNELIKQLTNDHEAIEQISRAQLLDDSFNLGRAGLIDQTIFLNISNYLLNEKSPLPFRAAFYGLDFISDIISSDSNANDMFTVN
jgi:aminopeptidase N